MQQVADLPRGGPVRSAEAPGARPLTALERAIVEAVCYADVFDWPLTPGELHASLPLAATRLETDRSLRSPRLRPLLGLADGLVTLTWRDHLRDRRHAQARSSRRLWPRAIRSARAIARLPSVRLVAVTGSLAAGSAGPDADIDLFVVTTDGRLWLTRALTIGVVRVAAAAGTKLCPNYFLAESALELPERDRFTAVELVQMVPIAGHATYEALLAANAWYREFLPNHRPAQQARREAGHRLAEAALHPALVDRLERWEMERKVRRLAAAGTTDEQRFGPTVCKGHFEGHRRRALATFAERLAVALEAVA